MHEHDLISLEPARVVLYFRMQTVHRLTGIHPVKNDTGIRHRLNAKFAQAFVRLAVPSSDVAVLNNFYFNISSHSLNLLITSSHNHSHNVLI